MDWSRGPPVLVGEKVLWSSRSHNRAENAVIKWIGNIPQISSDWCVGIELDMALPSLGGDGFWKNRKLFECRSKHGLLVPIEEIQKFCSKKQFGLKCAENCSNFKPNDTQVKNFLHPNCRPEEKGKNQIQYSNSKSKETEEALNNQTQVFSLNRKQEARKSISDFLKEANISQEILRKQSQNVKNLREKIPRRNNQKKASAPTTYSYLDETLENSESFDSKPYIKELIKNMNEVAGYFKEIKEGEERLQKQQNENNSLSDLNEASHSKPKKLFSFLKWFNKKHKNEPNVKLYKESSAASSPIFSRKGTSSCESIDTLFSTQTVRSFAYIPPTQYVPSAPPLDYDKSSYENVFEDFSSQKKSKETESLYDRRKKRKAPEPPRFSRENSLPTTLEHIKNEENFNEIKTCHRRTVSESFKDKKAGAYCHVQGKRKAPPPPAAPLYPNLEKLNNQHPSLHKKKKPAPPPPDLNFENQSPNAGHLDRKDVHVKKETSQPREELKIENPKDLRSNENDQKEEKEMKINQTSKDRLTKDVSLSPLPSRPWYKRSHRDSSGSNIIRKDLLKGFDKKKNKESDDWMPEVGFSRRSLSTESTHSKFNIFSKLEKTEDKKKEEKRKSQISILTNISELDREAAEIVKKEKAEEKKLIEANDAKYYSTKKLNEKIHEFTENSIDLEEILRSNKVSIETTKPKGESDNQSVTSLSPPRDISGRNRSKEENVNKEENAEDEHSKNEEEKLRNKENNVNPSSQLNENSKQNSFSLNVLADLTNSSCSTFAKSFKPQSPSQARVNYFNVQNKELNYLNEPWVCQKCTLENPGWRVFCEICGSVKQKFSFYNAIPQKETQSEKKAVKPDSVSKITDKPTVAKQRTELIPQKEDEPDNEVTPMETLDELRKKRMNFFISKPDNLSTLNKNEPKLAQDEDDKTKLKKILKEMKDSLPKNNAEKEKIKEEIKRTQESNFKEQSKKVLGKEELKGKTIQKEYATVSSLMEEEKEDKKENQERSDKSNVLKEESEKALLPVQNNSNNTSKGEQTTQTPNQNPPKEIEAYVITKTYVLEDIIIKKPERSKKVSRLVQAKPSFPTTSGIKVVHPPPRTKKVAFDKTNKKTASENSEDASPKRKNYQQEDLEELTTKLTQMEGLADFKANIEAMPLNTEMNTVAVNRLLRKLETAIKCGDHFVAAGLAKELALMKINCSVTRQATSSSSSSMITADLYIEDKVSHQGPIPLKVSPKMTLLQLKEKVQQEFGISLEVQRWILDKKLANNDSKTLEAEGVKNNNCPLFLYLVAPDDQKTGEEAAAESNSKLGLKPPQDSQLNEISHSGLNTKGWYYNYEEDHYSYCEDSENESNSSSTNLSNETEGSVPLEKSTSKSFENDIKKIKAEQSIKQTEKPVVFNLRSTEAESDVEKELKFISLNSVKQKVEKLNKTFAENANAVKTPLRSSRSPETWKCGFCNVVNLPGRTNCSSCNAKKVVTKPNSRKFEPPKADQFKRNNVKPPQKVNENVHYKALIELQDADLVPNSEPFSCSVCMVDYAPGEGVTLKDCLHTFCRSCLVSTVQYSEDAEVKCPYLDETYSCPSVLQQREIKALVPQKIFELHLAKSVKEAENKIENAFHCKTPDCKGWCIYEDNVNEFRCPVCKSTNCLTCHAIHTGVNCREYQERMKDASETDMDAKKTREMLNEMVERGEAMVCPKCQVVLMKKWGCDWLRCSMCKTEICWVTRGFRWGPEGKGDTSGGCKCGVNGVKCHPKCNYCH